MASLNPREQELEAIFSLSPDGIVTVSRQGFIQSINPAFLSMTGFNRDNLANLSEQAFNHYLDQSCHPVLPYINRTLDQQHVNQKTYVMNLSQSLTQTLNQQTTPLKKRLVMTRTDRQIAHTSLSKILYFRDITVETEIAEMKSEFLATAAHELRTPMASVFGFSELLLSRQFDTETTREILSTIHQQSASLVTLLSQLLDLARIGMDFVLTKQPLLDIVNRAINELLVPGDPRRIKRRQLTDNYWVFADADKLRQVITHVLSNAYKYSTTDHIDISLKQRQINDQAEVGIVIRDRGMGLDEEQLKHIFIRFWRANNIGNIPGAGLGMSLVKEIMALHQGQVEITSKPGTGTTVILWLKQISADAVVTNL
ncbi:MAG: PAS domain-containing sensor histidine kinase [Methylobacter sp.]|nr:PAS domain-containing sensor histidine kinase [Methylobacter sp.]